MISLSAYKQEHLESIQDPEAYWEQVAREELSWMKPWEAVTASFEDPTQTRWFPGATLNITLDCLDRHADGENGEKTAYIYCNENLEERRVSYRELRAQVGRCANALRSLGVTSGDTVSIYMPISIEQIVAMLACARIGAIHSVVYAGFSVEALRDRIESARSAVVIVAEYALRRGKQLPLLSTARQAVSEMGFSPKLIVLNREAREQLRENEYDWSTLQQQHSPICPAQEVSSEHPLFILYTSGTTGQPKGVVHATAGYHLYTHWTMKRVFSLEQDDIYWCTADCGWITGHSYIVYGPLSVGATTVIFEGAPDFPSRDHWWSLIEKYRVTVFYTAPTAIRLFQQWGEQLLVPYDLSSLRLLGSVGEPLGADTSRWYSQHLGKGRASVVDTWWQTETGGHMLVTLPGLPSQPGKAGPPFFGIQAEVVNEHGEPVPDGEKGHLVIAQPWPGALLTCWEQPERYAQYWQQIPGKFFTGDWAIRDEEGYIQVLGRSDDTLSVSGHRIGSAEVEAALVVHPAVIEAAVIGVPDQIKGERMLAFVVLQDAVGAEWSQALERDIQDFVRERFGHHLVPSEIRVVTTLPKTRSGKIMRRLLRAQETGQAVGDTSTLEE